MTDKRATWDQLTIEQNFNSMARDLDWAASAVPEDSPKRQELGPHTNTMLIALLGEMRERAWYLQVRLRS